MKEQPLQRVKVEMVSRKVTMSDNFLQQCNKINRTFHSFSLVTASLVLEQQFFSSMKPFTRVQDDLIQRDTRVKVEER